MKKGGGSASTIIIDPSKSVLIYALHSLEKRPRPCSISDVCAKIIFILLIVFLMALLILMQKRNILKTI